MTIRTLDLFCGAGGSSWGAQLADAQIVCGIDASERAVEAFRKNFVTSSVIHKRMTERTGAKALGDVGRIDLILSSPECTHHTCARGSRPRDEESKRTAFYVTRFARDLQPRWVVVENVVHMKGWGGYERLLDSLGALHYRLSVVTLDAAHFGVPQARRRVFILGDREADPPTLIRPTHLGPPRPARDILDPPGRWKSRPLAARAAATRERALRAVAELGPRRDFLIVYYGSDGSGGWQSLDRPLRTVTTLDRFGLVTWHGDEPMLRMLQVSELKRAMGFDDRYSLDGIGQRRDKIRLLGNGVCPPVMQAIVAQLTGQRAADSQTSQLQPLMHAAE